MYKCIVGIGKQRCFVYSHYHLFAYCRSPCLSSIHQFRMQTLFHTSHKKRWLNIIWTEYELARTTTTMPHFVCESDCVCERERRWSSVWMYEERLQLSNFMQICWFLVSYFIKYIVLWQARRLHFVLTLSIDVYLIFIVYKFKCCQNFRFLDGIHTSLLLRRQCSLPLAKKRSARYTHCVHSKWAVIFLYCWECDEQCANRSQWSIEDDVKKWFECASNCVIDSKNHEVIYENCGCSNNKQ